MSTRDLQKAIKEKQQAIKEKEKLEEQLLESRNKIKDLEKQLNEKLIDVPAVVEKFPDEIQRELEALRKQVKSQNNKPAVKLSYCFERLVSGFQELQTALEEVKETDNGEQEHEKYKNAVTGLLDKMNKTLVEG